MAVIKNIYFKDRVAEWIIGQPKGSVAPLIHGLIEEHIRKTELDDLTKEELELELKKAELKTKYEKELKDLQNANTKRN